MKPLKKFAACMAFTLCAAFNLGAQPAQAQQTQAPDTAIVQDAPAAKPDTTLPPAKPEMTLRFYNLHTEERLTLTRHAGEALPANVEWFMRDHRDNKTATMDPKLFDLLGRLQAEVVKRHPGRTVTFEVISAYRTPGTNENLRGAGGDQAKLSQHLHGRALDIRISGVTTRELRDISTCLKAGGVGYYATDRFVHVDVARVRYWPSHDYLTQLPCNKKAQPVVATAQKPPRVKRG